MRKMLLSFKPKVYDKIASGIKIYEHRRHFPDEPVMAYMYVSKPRREIRGIVYLGKRELLSDWQKFYSFDSEAVERIKEYREHYQYVMPIERFEETSAISLDDLKRDVPSFIVPQSYIYLDEKSEVLSYITSRLVSQGNKIEHDFSNISSDLICVH